MNKANATRLSDLASIFINGICYEFPRGWIISENYNLDCQTHLSNNPDKQHLFLPLKNTLSLSLVIPAGNHRDTLYYRLAKYAMRAMQMALTNILPHLEEAIEKTDSPLVKSLWAIHSQISMGCSYFGIHHQLPCCLVSGLHTSCSPQNSDDETWNINLTEVDLSYHRRVAKDVPGHAPKETVILPSALTKS